MRLKRILCPTDFSENADYAFQYALAFARKFDAKLYVLHVIHFPPQLRQSDIRQVIDLVIKSAEINLKELLGKSTETEVTFHPAIRTGAEYSEITELAGKEKIDLIVMGTHGRTGLAHAFLGSVAERVVRHAPCPVLTVRLPAIKGAKAVKRR